MQLEGMDASCQAALRTMHHYSKNWRGRGRARTARQGKDWIPRLCGMHMLWPLPVTDQQHTERYPLPFFSFS